MVLVDNNLQQLALTVFYLLRVKTKPCIIYLQARLQCSSSIHPLSKENASLAPFPLKSASCDWMILTKDLKNLCLTFVLLQTERCAVYLQQTVVKNLTTILKSFLSTFAAILSQILPDPHLHLLHPACTHFITSFVDFLLFSMIKSGYLNLSTCTASPLCIFNVTNVSLSFTHTCLLPLTFILILIRPQSLQASVSCYRSEYHLQITQSMETSTCSYLSICPSPLQTKKCSELIPKVTIT